MPLSRISSQPELPARRASLPVMRWAASQPQTQDFLGTLRKLWRHRLLALVCAVLGTLVGGTIALALHPYYLAEAQVLIGVPEPRIFSTDQLLDPAGPDAEKVENERVAMMSRELALNVVTRLDLSANPVFAPPAKPPRPLWRRLLPVHELPKVWRHWIGTSSPGPAQQTPTATGKTAADRLVDAVLSRVDVTRMGRSEVLAIDVKAPQPDLAARIANAWAAVYLKSKRDQKLAQTNRVEAYLTQRIVALRQKVQASEQAVEDYRRENALYRGTNAGVTTEQLTDLNTQLILAQTAKAEADARLRQAVAIRRDGLDNGTDPAVLGSQMIQALKVRQAVAEQKLAELRTTYGNRYPKVIEANAEVADLKRKLANEVSRTIAGLRNAARTADIRYETLQSNFQNLQTHMGKINGKAIHLQALEREATVNRNLLQALLSRAGETIGRQELEQPDARLVSAAAPPLAPGFPPRKLIVLLGTIAGALVGVMAALMRESADRTFRAADDIAAATGLPVIASVPVVAGRVPPATHVLRRPVSPYSEALRKLYIGLLLSDAPRPPKTTLLCSSVPGEGKSVLAASLARMLAANGKRVLVMDCDWRSPALHRVFHCSNKAGLAALMSEETPNLRDLIFTDPMSGVDVLAAGGWTPRAAHLMTSERMRQVIGIFAKNYDLVVLDGPPVLAAADALPLACMVDKSLFVVRWGHTPRAAVRDAMRQLAEVHADLAGVVFSRVDPKRYRQYTYTNLNYEYVRSAA